MNQRTSFRTIFSLFWLLIAVHAAAAETPVKTLTISEAVKIALEKNPANLSQIEAVNSSDAALSTRRSLLLPQITAQGSALQKKDAATIVNSPFAGEDYNQYNASIRLTQMVFQVGSLSAVSSARKDWEHSKLNAQVSTRDLTNNTISTYFLAVLAKRNLDTLLRQQQIVRNSVNISKRKERFGFAQSSDTLQVQTQLALLDGQITTANNEYQVVVADLARLLGSHDDLAFRMKDSLEAPPLKEIDQSVDLKNYQIPELEITRLQLEQIQDLKRVTLGQQLPSLAAIGEYNYNSYKAADLFDEYSAGWYVGLQLTIPLFSGFSSFYGMRSLSSRELQVQFQKQSIEDRITFQQVSNRKKLEAAHNSITTGIEALRLATASSKAAQRSYNLSRMEFFQFFQVQQALLQAEQSLNNAKYNYITALANYYVASGQDMPKLVEAIERNNP